MGDAVTELRAENLALRESLERRREYWTGYADAESELVLGTTRLTEVRRAAVDLALAAEVALGVLDDLPSTIGTVEAREALHAALKKAGRR